MFERVVRAVDRAVFADPLNRCAIARAAIEAMREPTDEMADEGVRAVDPYSLPHFSENDADIVWRAMIDAALKEKADG